MSEFDADSRQGGFVDTNLQSAPKKIIICCDGTWQSSVTNKTNVPSNVTRIARYLTKVGRDGSRKEWQQLVYYDGGIGTGVSDVEAKIQGGTGTGFIDNVIEAYNFIVLNYNPGDQIFCIGFSRGAYTARAVAGLVTDIGIIRPRDMQDFPELFRLYQKHTDSHLFRKSAVWREWVEGKRSKDWKGSSFEWEKRPHYAAPESTRWVEAVGVFDTVGSLGIPPIPGLLGFFTNIAGKVLPVEEFGFHNVALSPYIKNAYHAMALDEHRKPFSPTLWHYPADGVATLNRSPESVSELKEQWNKLKDTPGATDAKISELWGRLVNAEMFEELEDHKSRLVQVWFPGVHINVGGGSDDIVNPNSGYASDFEQIAMITLCWMVEQLKSHLTFEINFTNLSTTDRFLLMRPVVEELITKNKKDHWLINKINSIISKDSKNDPWNDGNKTRTKVLAADALRGWATGPIIDSFQGEMKKAGSLYRSPGEYKETTLQDGSTVKLGRTNEYIHPTVKYRMDVLGHDYIPIALKGFDRKPGKDKSGTFQHQWVKNDITVPEWKIGDMNSFERACTVSDASKAFLGALDQANGIDSWEARALEKNP